MNYIRRALNSAVILAVAVGVLLPISAAHAQQYTGGNGLKISPVRSDLTINPGSSAVVDIYVQNLTSTPAQLQTIVNDFVASNESGQPALILNPNQSASAHGLKQFITPMGNFTLQPGQQQDVKVLITIPAGTAGGGYYGAIRFAPVSASSNKNVTLAASVGSLILVKVPGNIKEQLGIASFDVSQGGGSGTLFGSNKQLSVTVRFQNSGNIQLEPFGKIVLKRGSTILETQEINNTSPRGNVLPGSIRRFSVPLTAVGSFGRYTVEGNFGYGSHGQLLSAQKTFYVVPLTWIIVALVLLALLLLAVFGLPKAVRAYNRRIISRAR